MRTSGFSGKVWIAGMSFKNIPKAEGDDTHLEYLLNFLGPTGWKKLKQWTSDGATAAICEKTKKSASEFMKFLHEGMDHPVSHKWKR